MATDKKLSSLVINTLTQAQYDSATKNEDELYLTPDDTDEQLANKQDKLVSGTNIKTVNGNSLLGSGNIDIQFYEHNIYMLYENGSDTFCIRFAFVNNVSDTYTSVSALQGYLGTNFVKGCSGYMSSSAGYGNAYSVTYNKVSGVAGTAQASITYSSTGLTITDTIKEMS